MLDVTFIALPFHVMLVAFTVLRDTSLLMHCTSSCLEDVEEFGGKLGEL
jgi:hypothetical protein